MASLIRPPHWQGTPERLARLEEAVRANCAERDRLDGEGRDARCYACDACLLFMDQGELDRLCFSPDGAIFTAAEQTEPPNVGRWFVKRQREGQAA